MLQVHEAKMRNFPRCVAPWCKEKLEIPAVPAARRRGSCDTGFFSWPVHCCFHFRRTGSPRRHRMGMFNFGRVRRGIDSLAVPDIQYHAQLKFVVKPPPATRRARQAVPDFVCASGECASSDVFAGLQCNAKQRST